MTRPLTPARAVRRILADIAALPTETVPLADAQGRVLAEEVATPFDIPPWDNSAMDGYGLRVTGDGWRVAGGGGGEVFRVIEVVHTGAFPAKRPGRGECVRVFTGAPTPLGCDTVIRQEDVTVLPDGRVRVERWRDLGKNVRPRGGDLRRGEVAVGRGTALTAAHLGVLASVARRDVTVHRRPKVAFLATGDEIAGPEEYEAVLAGRKIASSNSVALGALIAEAGGIPVDLGIARDDPADLRNRLAGAAACDLLLTTAGVSVGEHDHVRGVLDEMGLKLDFWRVRMRPGAPVGFGWLGDQPWIGLPGNPVSTMVTFELFARPVMRRMLGHTRLFRVAVEVRSGEAITLAPGLQHFLRVRLRRTKAGVVARLTGPQGSGVLTSMAKAEALMIVPEGKATVRKGERLQAIRLAVVEHGAQAPY